MKTEAIDIILRLHKGAQSPPKARSLCRDEIADLVFLVDVLPRIINSSCLMPRLISLVGLVDVDHAPSTSSFFLKTSIG